MEFIKEDNAFVHYNEAKVRDAEITFVPSGDDMIIVDHTYVDPSLRGQGIARQLVDRVASFARQENKKIIPVCPYVVDLFKRSNDYDDVKK